MPRHLPIACTLWLWMLSGQWKSVSSFRSRIVLYVVSELHLIACVFIHGIGARRFPEFDVWSWIQMLRTLSPACVATEDFEKRRKYQATHPLKAATHYVHA